MIVVGSRRCPDQLSVKRLLHCLDMKGVHSLSACTLGHGSLFVVQSMVLVSITKCVRLWTYLVVEDGLL